MGEQTNCKSVIWFTVHKCASVYTRDILKKLANEAGMNYADYEGDFWLKGKHLKDVLADPQTAESLFEPEGYIYGPFREFYREIPDLDNYKIILMLRDPRDVLTSAYFSFVYSHIAPTGAATSQSLKDVRQHLLETGTLIDDFVIGGSCMGFLKRYQEYAQECLGKDYVCFVTYEDMVSNFSSWLDEVLSFTNIKVNKIFFDSLVKEANFSVKEENVYAHKRQVTPGDYKRKLKLKTIQILNTELAEVLQVFGYLKNEANDDFEVSQLALNKAREILQSSQDFLQQFRSQPLHG